MSTDNKNILVLFDIDGTLTEPMCKIDKQMLNKLQQLRNNVVLGVVGGSDVAKGKNQLGDHIFDLFDYYFPQNGLQAYEGRTLIHDQSLIHFLGEESIERVIKCALYYIADLDIPKMGGTFVEQRSGMINICPVGRNCTQSERNEFSAFDEVQHIRLKMVEYLKHELSDLNLRFVIGGQISIDVFPMGWDKTYCLQHVKHRNFEKIYFFGDKTEPGENDYEIYTSDQTIGYKVKGPSDTMRLLDEIFFNIDS